MIQLPTPENPVPILCGDVRSVVRELPSDHFQAVITSPPYWGVRDYGFNGQIGSEASLDDYVSGLVEVFREVRRTLRPDGTFWLNIANTYSSGNRTWRAPDEKNKGRAMSYRPPTPPGLKPKDLVGVAWKVAMALQYDGWYLRNDIIWHKPNCQPESVKDRFTVAHEYIFMFSKSERYSFYQLEAAEERKDLNGHKNRRTVWPINTEPYPEAHFAVFPRKLIEPCILAATMPGDMILDPFFGSGTVGLVARTMDRLCLGIELKPESVELAMRRLDTAQLKLLTAG
ncbi:MAG: site-specific DNA-methyltransferase [Fimbriimonadaceae bacterium]|nr:site-specific DNA-methyltransferase [Fimbriimonadaceae bacterium]